MRRNQSPAARISSETSVVRCKGAASKLSMGWKRSMNGLKASPRILTISRCWAELFQARGNLFTMTFGGRVNSQWILCLFVCSCCFLQGVPFGWVHNGDSECNTASLLERVARFARSSWAPLLWVLVRYCAKASLLNARGKHSGCLSVRALMRQPDLKHVPTVLLECSLSERSAVS